MAKVRFSISLDEDDAARIKAAAARAGEDVSAYMGKAASEAVERDDRVAEVFADIDRQIREAEEASDAAPIEEPNDELPAAEREQINRWWDAFFAERGRGAA